MCVPSKSSVFCSYWQTHETKTDGQTDKEWLSITLYIVANILFSCWQELKTISRPNFNVLQIRPISTYLSGFNSKNVRSSPQLDMLFIANNALYLCFKRRIPITCKRWKDGPVLVITSWKTWQLDAVKKWNTVEMVLY